MAAKRGKKAKPEAKTEQVKVPLNWMDDDAMGFVFANELFTRYSGSMYLLSFAQAHGPYELEYDIPKMKKEGVQAKMVAKVAVSPTDLARMLEHLNGLYARMSKEQKPKKA